MFQLTTWSIPPLIAAIVALTAYRRSRTNSQVPGRLALSLFFAALTFWSIAATVGTIVTSETAQLVAAQLAYVGIVLTPVAWFVFALTYSQRVLRISRRALNSICVIPLITVALAITNPWHHLIWSSWEMVQVDGFVGLVTIPGFWLFIHTIYSYCLLLCATAILAFSLTQFRQHDQTLLAAVFAPLIGVLANLFYLSPANPWPWFDMTTLGFVAGVIILEKGILQKGSLKVLPVVRERIVEQLADPVLVITNKGKIVDANKSALAAWSTATDTIVYTNITALVRNTGIADLIDADKNTEAKIKDHEYEISATHVDSSNPDTDIALVFRNVTERRRQERQLATMAAKLEKMAHTDALTGLFNRRFFTSRLQEEYARVRRHKGVMSVLMLDLDHFKQVNDTFGHDFGDAVLSAVATVANRVKRTSDIVARVGGEEFALLLPHTDQRGALLLADRLRNAIEAYPYRQKLNADLTVTASIGVATVTPSITAAELLKVADRALYRAKHSGRNRVCVDEEGAD